MVLAELFFVVIAILILLFIIRVAARKFRRAGVVGRMNEIAEREADAEDVRRFKARHGDPAKDKKVIDDFTQGR